MAHFLIIGAGGFGRRAVGTIGARFPGAIVTLVDHDPTACARLPEATRSRVIAADGIAYLTAVMSGQMLPDWIIPALPRHLAFEWVRARLQAQGFFEPLLVPEAIGARLPNPMRGPAGEVYFSNADFICPAACPEPDEICTHTGQLRPRTLHAYLPTLCHPPFRSLVLRSLPLAPGVGGYRPAELFRLLAEVQDAPGHLLLSTACACHGVMHGLRYGQPGGCGQDEL